MNNVQEDRMGGVRNEIRKHVPSGSFVEITVERTSWLTGYSKAECQAFLEGEGKKLPNGWWEIKP